MEEDADRLELEMGDTSGADDERSDLASCPDTRTPLTGECTPTFPEYVKARSLVKPLAINTVTQLVDVASENMRKYQNSCILVSSRYAAKELVLKASHQDTITDQIGHIHLDIPTVRQFLNIASLVSGLGENHRSQLATVLSWYRDAGSSRVNLPSSTQEFKSHILNTSNKNSLHSLLPVPSFNIAKGTELTTCSIREMTGFAMMFPSSPDFADLHPRFFSIVESRNFQKQLSTVPTQDDLCMYPCVVAYAIMWSDGWDPNTQSKGNRASVWTGTAGLLLVDVSVTPFPYDLVPSLWSVGGGKDGHNSAFGNLFEELNGMDHETAAGVPSPFQAWSQYHGSVVTVYVRIGPFLQDQLERRAAAHLLGGNSNMHALFGTSCSFDKLSKPFNACVECIVRLDEYILRGKWSQPARIPCDNCLGWDIDTLQTEGIYTAPLVDLASFNEGDHGHTHSLKPREITFHDTSLAFEFAFQKYVEEGIWNRQDVRKYHELFCISPALTQQFLHQSQKHMSARECRKEDSEAFGSEFERLSLLHETEENPSSYLPPVVPAIWKTTSVRNLPESIMHLAMNLQKAVLNLMFVFANNKSMGSHFVKRSHPLLKMVENLSVSSAPARTFKNNKFGGFVAENYRAVTMILPWWSHILLEADFLKQVAVADYSAMEQKPFEKWTVPCIKNWLTVRGYEFTKDLLKQDLLAELRKYHGLSSSTVVEPNTPATCTAGQLRDLIFRAHKLFATLFATDETGVSGRNRYSAVARRFMSAIEEVEHHLDPYRKKPIWLSKYNTIGALRAAEMFEDHHLARNMHEGGDLGESVVKKLRALCPQAVRDGWSSNLINAFYRNRAIEGISRSMDDFEGPKGIGAAYLSKFKRYKSEYEVNLNLEAGGVLSGLAFWDEKKETTKIGVVINNQGWYFLEILLDYSTPRDDPAGFPYFPVVGTGRKIPYTADQQSLDLVGDLSFRKFVLFLPFLWAEEGRVDFQYAIVSEDWDYLQREGWVNV
jgi:hypothetical protein